MYNQVVEPGTPDADALTDEQAGRIFAAMNEVIRAGEETRRLRAELIEALAALGWTQDAIARLAGMSQPAVSKQIGRAGRARGAEPAPPIGLALDQHDVPWLEGRLWGLAEEISETLDGTAACSGHVHALARGRKRFSPQGVDALRRLVEADLRDHGADLPPGCRDAYDAISRALDVPAKSAAPAPGSASVRRALACGLQRDRLRAGA